jgi:hypothetical protein
MNNFHEDVLITIRKTNECPGSEGIIPSGVVLLLNCKANDLGQISYVTKTGKKCYVLGRIVPKNIVITKSKSIYGGYLERINLNSLPCS